MVDDGKCALNQFCQLLVGRPIQKGDLVYSTQSFDEGYQGTVTVVCHEGQAYAGRVMTDKKAAEKSAAEMALSDLKARVPETQLAKSKKAAFKNKQQKQASKSDVVIADEKLPPGAFTSKVELNSLLGRIIKRPLSKGEQLYDSQQCDGGFQATVTLSCLPGEWQGKAWAGKVCESKQQAEFSAAEMALQTLKELPEFQALALLPAKRTASSGPPQKKQKGSKGSKGGKGASKGKGKSGAAMGPMTITGAEYLTPTPSWQESEELSESSCNGSQENMAEFMQAMVQMMQSQWQ
jgi:hypothetical protein